MFIFFRWQQWRGRKSTIHRQTSTAYSSLGGKQLTKRWTEFQRYFFLLKSSVTHQKHQLFCSLLQLTAFLNKITCFFRNEIAFEISLKHLNGFFSNFCRILGMTMERATLEINPPRDKLNIIYFILLLHGIGTLMPWNMFITANSVSFETF